MESKFPDWLLGSLGELLIDTDFHAALHVNRAFHRVLQPKAKHQTIFWLFYTEQPIPYDYRDAMDIQEYGAEDPKLNVPRLIAEEMKNVSLDDPKLDSKAASH